MRTVALFVPSAVTTNEDNILINPKHPDFGKITLHAPEPREVVWTSLPAPTRSPK